MGRYAILIKVIKYLFKTHLPSMMATSFCRGFSTIHIKGTGKALSLPEVWNSRVDWMMNGWTGGLNAVIQMLSLDLRQRDEGETVTDPLGFREVDEFVLMRSVRAEAKSDGRQWNCLCPQHLTTESNRFNDLMLDNMSSLTRRRQICSIVIIKYTERSTLPLFA